MSSYKDAGRRKGDYRRAESVLPFCLDFLDFLTRHEGNKKLIVVRYEDFCAKPKETLESICKFVGVVFEESMLNPINSSLKARGHILKGNRLLRSTQPLQIREDRSWQQTLTSEELDALYNNEALLNLYVKYGYTF